MELFYSRAISAIHMSNVVCCVYVRYIEIKVLIYAVLNSLRNSNLQQMGSCQSGGSVPAFGAQTTITLASTNIVSSAQFFVFTGVTAFLYSLFMGVVYVFFRQKYSNMVFFSLIVCVMSCHDRFFISYDILYVS